MNEQPILSAFDAIYRRRATRAYTSDVVPEDKIRELMRAAIHAPTALHREPWSFVIIQDRHLLSQISDLAKKNALAAPPELRELPREASGLRALLANPSFDIFYGASTLVVICTDQGPFATADAWLAAENLMLAATALGLATCPIGFALPALEDKSVRAELRIPDGVVAVAPIIVGVPAIPVAPTTRKEPRILSWVYRKESTD